MEFLNFLLDNLLYLPFMVGLFGIGGGGSFNYSQSESNFQNQQGVAAPYREQAYFQIAPTVSQAVPYGFQTIQQTAPPSLKVDQYGGLQTPGSKFNLEGFLNKIVGDALSRTAAQRTARGQVSPENLGNFAQTAAQNVALQYYPQAQQNILAKATIQPNFELQRAGLVYSPSLQAGTNLATGGGSGFGSSNAFGFGGSAHAQV